MTKSGRVLLLGLAFFCLAMFTSSQVTIYYKVTQMPAEIRYQIITYNNTWPDQFYSSGYSTPGGTGFRLETYWTFEPSKKPLSAPRWVYHPEPLVWENVNSVVREIKR